MPMSEAHLPPLPSGEGWGEGSPRKTVISAIYLPVLLYVLALLLHGCNRGPKLEVVTVYCAVDKPYASQIFQDFEKQTGIRVAPLYDIESSKSVGLAGKLEAERDHPRAAVWWGSEAFLTTRLAEEGTALLEGREP
jgi:iron(III) transport system substrate-binding protein